MFSITSPNETIEKAGIYLDLARFLTRYNKGKETVIPLHLPYYEKWKTPEKVMIFGGLTANSERDAVANAEKTLRYLEEKWNKENGIENIRLALETGSGEAKRGDETFYALLYKPHQFKFLMQGRDFVGLCEDVAHLNLVEDSDWSEYLSDPVFEFHVSGNNGKEDIHTLATPSTLRNYPEIISFLRFYPGNICCEIKRKGLTEEEFLNGIKNLAYTLFIPPNEEDYKRMQTLEKHIQEKHNTKINPKNLNDNYQKYRTRQV
jgi:hypothetical protein